MVTSKMQLLPLFFAIAVACCAGKSVEGPRRAVVILSNEEVIGKIILEQASASSPVKISGSIQGLSVGQHGMHIHEGRQLGNNCQHVGQHFNPTGAHHGGPRDSKRHVGDLGNIKTIASGSVTRTEISMISPLMSLYEDHPNNIVERALVIHAQADDLGRGDSPDSLKNGNSGPYVACGLVEQVDLNLPVHEKVVNKNHKTSEEKPWKEVAPTFTSQIPSNLNVEGLARPDLGQDGFELKNAVPTYKIWKTRNSYEYDYSGFISAGVMGVGPKLSGGSISGRLIIEPVDDHTIIMALKNTRGKMFNEDVLEEFVKAEPGQETPVMDQEHLEKPIQLRITNGKIDTVSISKEEPLWTVNFKRALAAQLQLQLDTTSGVFHKAEPNNYYAENTAYQTLEGSSSGECQTWYHINRIPIQQLRANPQLLAVPELCDEGRSPVYEIVKNRDFDKCHNLPMFNYISTPGLQCDISTGSSCQNQWAHVDTVRIIGCKVDENTFIVQRIKSMDRLVNKPFGYETEAIEGLTIQHLHLAAIKPLSTSDRLSLPRDVQSFKTLVYAFDEAHQTEGSRMNQPGLRDDNNPLVMDVDDTTALKESERLLMEIVRDLESAQYYADPSGKLVSDKIHMLSKAVSNLDYTTLSTFTAKYITPENNWSTVNQIVVDALVLSGTNPSLMIVRDWIIKGRLSGEQAIQAIAMLPAVVKTPTRELLTNLMELLKSEPVMRNKDLKYAAALSVSRLVYQACINSTTSANLFPKLLMGDFCSLKDSVVSRQLIPWLNQQLKTAVDDIERIAMLAALGNIGNEIIVPTVLPHIASCEPSSHYEAEWYQRHRRSMKKFAEEEDDEEMTPLGRKEWRNKWISYKQKNNGKQEDVEDVLERFENELKADKKSKKERPDKSHHGKKEEKKMKKEQKEEEKKMKKEQKEEEKIMQNDEKEAMKIKWNSNDDSLELVNQDIDLSDDFEDKEESDDELRRSSDEDQAGCNILRTKAIFALSTMAVNQDPLVAKILLPIFQNKAEETEIRLSALSLLFISNPPASFWERVALSTWTESNDQVSHYIYTTIASLVSNKDPKRRDITMRAESVLPMMKPMRWTSFVSSNYLRAAYDEKSRLGYLTKTVNFPGHESFIPSNHYNSLYLNAGPWFMRLFDISINSKQPEKLIDLLLGKPALRGENKDNDRNVKHPELEKMREELKIEARATGQPEIFIYANLADNYQRFLAINPHSIERMTEEIIRRNVKSGEMNVNYHKMVPIVDVFGRIPSSMGLAYSAIAQARLMLSVRASARTSFEVKSMGPVVGRLEGTLEPVVNFDWTSKITVETPFTRSYPTAGVHIEVLAGAPGRFSLSGDVSTGKYETTWEFLGDKLRLVRHAVVPFTTIRKLGDYTPSRLLTETRPITLLEKPLTTETTFGHKTLGLNMIWAERGDAQSIKAPASFNEDLFGSLLFSVLPSTLRFHERNLMLDNANSETKVIKTLLSIASKDNENIKDRVREQEEEDELESIRNLKIGKKRDFINNDRHLQRLLGSMNDATGYSIGATVELSGSRTRRYGTVLSYGIGDYGLSHRSSMMMEKLVQLEDEREERAELNGEDSNFVVCVDMEAKTPKPVVIRREEFMRDDLTRTSSVKIGFGNSCTNDRLITITSKMARSEEDIPSTVQSKWQERECAKQEMFGRGVSEECLSTRRLATILNKGIITIDYNEMPSMIRNATVKVSNMFRYWMGAHMSDNQVDVQNNENQIRIETVYYPIIGSMDMRVYQPTANTFYHGIDVHPTAEAVLPFNPRLTAFRAIYGGPGLCLVDRNSVTTYDGLTYNATVAGCDKVITKDCSGRYNMAVLAREENNKKIVTVYLNEKKIELNAATMKVKVNDIEKMLDESNAVHQVKDNQDDVLALIRKTSDGFIELESPSHWIRVTVDANEVIVLNSPIHRGRLCGLCGSQTGNKVTDLTGPQKCSIPEDLMDVAYELRQPEGCVRSQTPGEREILNQVQKQCLKEESSSSFGVRPIASQQHMPTLSVAIRSVDNEDDCTVYRNRMVHRGRKRCFSIESAPKCAEGCHAVEFETVRMAFHCVAPGPQSDALKEAMFVRPLDELAGQIATTVTAFKVPTACAPGPNTERDQQSGNPHRRHGKKNDEEREPRHRFGKNKEDRESWLNE